MRLLAWGILHVAGHVLKVLLNRNRMSRINANSQLVSDIRGFVEHIQNLSSKGLPCSMATVKAMACRSELERLRAEEARANTGLQEGQSSAAEVEARAKERQQAVQELKADIEQLKDQLATGDQSVQVQSARVLSPDSSCLTICFVM